MTLDLPAALDDLGLAVMPVRLVGGSLYTPDGRVVRPLHAVEDAGFRLFYIGPGRCASRHHEWPRTWRCDQTTGHEGRHTSTSGHRSWPSTSTASASVDAGHNDQGAEAPAHLGALVTTSPTTTTT